MIVATAEKNRYNDGSQKKENDMIMISDQWLHELNAHPYLSSNDYSFTLVEKPGEAIHLIKTRSKLIRSKKSPKRYLVGARLDGSGATDEEMKIDSVNVNQRRKIKDAS